MMFKSIEEIRNARRRKAEYCNPESPYHIKKLLILDKSLTNSPVMNIQSFMKRNIHFYFVRDRFVNKIRELIKLRFKIQDVKVF